MAALSALAIVAQKAIAPEGQKAIPKALLVADLERTRLDYERSRMMAEDRLVRHARLQNQTTLRGEIVRNLRDALHIMENQRDNALHDLEAERTANRFEHEELLEELLEAERINAELLEDQPERLVHTVPVDTEIEARRKFLKGCQ